MHRDDTRDLVDLGEAMERYQAELTELKQKAEAVKADVDKLKKENKEKGGIAGKV